LVVGRSSESLVSPLFALVGEAPAAAASDASAVPEGGLGTLVGSYGSGARGAGVFGPNGAGKTTTVRAASGFLRSEGAHVISGSVAVSGADVTNYEPHQLARRGVFLAPERDKVFPNLSVTENLLTTGRSLPKARRHELFDVTHELFPVLVQRRRQSAGALSGGQRQMLAIARGIVTDPRVLIIGGGRNKWRTVQAEKLRCCLGRSHLAKRYQRSDPVKANCYRGRHGHGRDNGGRNDNLVKRHPVGNGDLSCRTSERRQNWFSSSPTSAGVATGAVQGLKGIVGSLSGKKVAFEGLENPAVDQHLTSIKDQLRSAGAIIGPSISDPISLTSWASQAQTVMQSNSDAVIINTSVQDTAIVAKALGVAGFKGPIISTDGAQSDGRLSSVNLPNFYVVREVLVPPTTSPMYAAADAAGGYADQVKTANPEFMREYADIYVIAAVLKKCGLDCSGAKFSDTLRGLGDIPIPGGAFIAPFNFSKSQSGLAAAQLYFWDAADNKSAPKGPVIDINAQ
jgi:hypothetical protein